MSFFILLGLNILVSIILFNWDSCIFQYSTTIRILIHTLVVHCVTHVRVVIKNTILFNILSFPFWCANNAFTAIVTYILLIWKTVSLLSNISLTFRFTSNANLLLQVFHIWAVRINSWDQTIVLYDFHFTCVV